MAELVKVQMETRRKSGTAEARRLRRRGRVPGNMYGHGGGPLGVSVPEEEITPLILGGMKVMDVQIDGDSQLAILRDLQWDPFGTKVIHFDLLRVNRDEKVEVEVPVELRGICPGSMAGGVLDQNLHTLSIECLPFVVPDHIEVRIGNLHIGDAVHVRDLTIPEGVVVQNPEEELVVQVTEPIEVPEEGEEAEADMMTEPEVIGREEEPAEQAPADADQG